jgi:signal transduction histidine kinase
MVWKGPSHPITAHSLPSGNGFGLPSARRNIERHGGTLRLADGGGIGLTVKIQIPI